MLEKEEGRISTEQIRIGNNESIIEKENIGMKRGKCRMKKNERMKENFKKQNGKRRKCHIRNKDIARREKVNKSYKNNKVEQKKKTVG